MIQSKDIKLDTVFGIKDIGGKARQKETTRKINGC
jgi:hypothetical protein